MKDESTLEFLDHMMAQAKYRRAHGGRNEANEAMKLENYIAERKEAILADPAPVSTESVGTDQGQS